MIRSTQKRELDQLWERYLSLGESAATIVRSARKATNSETRRKLFSELRSLDHKRLAILDEIDEVGKVSQAPKSSE